MRLGRHDDIPDIVMLELQARAALVGQRGGDALLSEVPPESDWPQVIDSGLVWVGEFAGVVVGFLQLQVGAVVASVRQVFVDPEARELGFGDALLGEAVAEARRRGCQSIEGVALPGDRETKNLYERAGITARKIVVSKRL